MKTTANIITFNWFNESLTRLVATTRKGRAALLSGPEGSGVTMTSRYVQAEWERLEAEVPSGKMGSPRQAVYIALRKDADALRSMQHVANRILGPGMPLGWQLHCVNELAALISNHIVRANIGLLIIDRSDLAGDEFVDALLPLIEDCAVRNHTLGILMGQRSEGRTQLQFFQAYDKTRIAYHARLPKLLDPDAMAVLMALYPAAAELGARYAAGDKTAGEFASKLVALSDGRFRLLTEFADYLNSQAGVSLSTAKALDNAWKEAFFGERKAAA